MCGIAGIINWTNGIKEDDLVKKMCRVMAYRGPDANGIHVISGGECVVTLGHNRLGIIDLSDAARQPMTNEDGSLWLVYNGEIYNFLELRERLAEKGHRFSSRTDSEVILHLYEEKGDRCIEDFRGIFAFALWDNKNRVLFAARDHFGVKPFYYWLDKIGNRIIFASEIKAILEDSRYSKKIDLQALDNYLRYQCIPTDGTIYEGINKLPAAYKLITSVDRLRLEQYWDIRYEPKNTAEEEDTLTQFKDLFGKTVKSQLISDVPLGAFLSGGVDSSAVVYAMTRYCSKPIQTFSIGFEEENKEICELGWAREVSKILGTNHHEIIVTLEDVFALFEKIMFQLDEPIADPACFPTFLLAEFARKKVTVVLTGEGGDELFAGYPLYGQFKSCLDQEKRIKMFPLEAKKTYVKIMANFDMNKRAIKKLFMKNCGRKIEETYPGLLKIFSHDERQLLYKKDFKNEVLFRNTEMVLDDMFRKTNASSDLDKMLFVDTKMSLPEALLMKIDKMTMRNSLEARVPFLDPLLAGFIATLPENLKVRGAMNKYLLKRYLAEKFPKRLFVRPKQGLILPLSRWLRAEDERWKEMLFDRSSISNIFFNQSYIENLWKDFMNGNDGRANQIWTLAVLNVWHDLYFNHKI